MFIARRVQVIIICIAVMTQTILLDDLANVDRVKREKQWPQDNVQNHLMPLLQIHDVHAITPFSIAHSITYKYQMPL